MFIRVDFPCRWADDRHILAIVNIETDLVKRVNLLSAQLIAFVDILYGSWALPSAGLEIAARPTSRHAACRRLHLAKVGILRESGIWGR